MRHYAGSEGWDATRYPAPAVAAISGALSPTQVQAVEQLHQRMGLTPADATQCLQQHAWDIERAAAAVQQMRTAGTCPM
ncbi:hypothetical protein IWQ60_012128 [Tieghemiomyces parasiticus]|uniref:TAP-C domain-containing protein n=1 Tax=Tieghemiomyces parasiticus TaxID=78921 RepID=A0A9W7ZQQ1_9FUNG|nr:hypothetical protein IWQ60_012128 [Tieghemiomyces parasiticus]